MSTKPYLLLSVSLVTLMAPLAQPAWGQSKQSTATAIKLFKEGQQLMRDGDCKAAIAKFEASMQLVPNLGTKKNLAVCHKRLGQLASAWSYYREAESMARKKGKDKAAAKAAANAEELEPQLSRLVIQVDLPADIEGLEVLHNGKAIASALFGEVMYVDPGPQEVVARANGYRPFQTTVDMAKGEEKTMTIDQLERDPTAEPAPEPMKDTRPPVSTTRKALRYGSLGVGTGAVLAGLATGWAAKSARDDAFDSGACNRDTLLCTVDGQAQMDRAHDRALYANILVGVGIVAVGAGVVLWLTEPGPGKRGGADQNALVPMVGQDHFGLAVTRSF